MCRKKQRTELSSILSKCNELTDKYDTIYSANAQINFRRNDDDYENCILDIKESMSKIAVIVTHSSESAELGQGLLQTIDLYKGKYEAEIKNLANPLRQALETCKATTSEEKQEGSEAAGIWKDLSGYLKNKVDDNTDLFLGVGDWIVKASLATGTVLAYIVNSLLHLYETYYYSDGFGIPKEYLVYSTGFSDLVITIILCGCSICVAAVFIVHINRYIENKITIKQKLIRSMLLLVLSVVFGFLFVYIALQILLFIRTNILSGIDIFQILLIAATSIIPLMFILLIIFAVATKQLRVPSIIFAVIMPVLFIVGLTSIKENAVTNANYSRYKDAYSVFYIDNYQEQSAEDCCQDTNSNNNHQYYAVVYQTDERVIAIPCTLNKNQDIITELASGTLPSKSYIVVSGENIVFTILPYNKYYVGE